MSIQKKDMRTKSAKFTSEQIKLAVDMVESLQTTLEVIYYLIEHEGADSFVMLFITAEEIELQSLLEKQKRATDLLYRIDEDKNYYVMICQDTKVDGGYHFSERLMKNINENNGKEPYCIALEVRSTKPKPKTVIFKLIEIFTKAQENNKFGEIVYKSIN